MRISPYGNWNGMSDSDPKALSTFLTALLNQFDLAYLHLIEPRISGSDLVHASQGPIASEQLRPLFKGSLIAAGGFEPATAEAAIAAGTVDAVAFGRYFVSNPDLPRRIEEHLTLASYDRATFYSFDRIGYTDYPPYGRALGA